MGKKLKCFIMGALCLLGLVAAGNSGQTVKAADAADTQEVVLTKFGFDKNATPDFGDKDTTQTVADVTNKNSDEAWAKNAKALSGVEFTVYDVTDQFWEEAGKGNTLAAENKLTQTLASKLPAPLAVGVTDANGQITFKLAKTNAKGQRSAYFFKETKGLPGYDGSQDFVLDMGAPVASDNKLYVYPKNSTVKTNFHKFVKVNSETKKPLADAEFQIKNAKGEYALLTNFYSKNQDEQARVKTVTGYVDAVEKGYDIVWTSVAANATTFVSDDNGEFGLGGVSDTEGSYQAIETKAPEHYKEADPTTFTFDGKETNIEDKPNAFLPHTGGAGIIGIIAAGVVLILATVFGIRKRQAQA